MIHVLQAANYKVYQGICLNALTICKFTKEPVHLHIMTIEIPWSDVPKISEEKVNHLRDVMKSYNPLHEVSYYDVSDEYIKMFENSKNKNPKYTPACLIRLLAPKFINCDKLIYLDTDILTCNSLTEFEKIDISDKELAIVKDYMGRFWIDKDYFNSGMLYINMNKIKETKLFERSIEMVQNKKLYFSDQTPLNKFTKDKIYLPFRFNEQRKIKPDTVIKHYCKGIQYIPYFKIYNYKQWDVYHHHKFLKSHYFDDIFDLYEELFPLEAKLIRGKN